MHVEDAGAVCQRALQAGATSVTEPRDQYYGDRNAGVKDASGSQWWIATYKEDVSEQEIARRAEEATKRRAAS